MSRAFEIVRAGIVPALSLLAIGWLFVRSVKRAEDPARLIFKWLLTAVLIGFMILGVGPVIGKGGYGGAFGGIPLAVMCLLVLTAIWRHSIGSIVAKPFSSLYDGGDDEPDPHPAYSVAQARQKQGKYLEAVAEIRKQLERFPTDFEGQMMLAEIQAQHLNDLPGAQLTIDRLCAQPGHVPKNLGFALYSMADWHLKIGQDREAARRSLERIVELFPGSEIALGAAHRIGHLSSLQMLLDPHERKKFAVTEGPRNLGLLSARNQLKRPEVDPEQAAGEYVRHLEQHPLDTEARENLAVIYADHYARLDLATDQLEQMIEQPNQPPRLVVHWLNLLADLQVRCGADFETVERSLRRIVERNPDLAAAEIARHRLALLKLELKAKGKSQAVKLGSYEQNIGLKQGSPRPDQL